MSYEAAWLILSFAILVVAVLVNVHGRLERLEEQLKRAEAGEGADDSVSRLPRGL
ncbi:MAG TPA: hypothetical protein VIF59_16870 [Methylomirabilota bacterium]|jgi:hypothetical protein